MEKISTFMYLYDNIESYEDLINANEVFELDDELSLMLDKINIIEQSPRKEITDKIIAFAKSYE